MISSKDPAFSAITIRVLIPKNDLQLVIDSVDEFDALILSIDIYNDAVYMVEFYLRTSFALYAIGKMVAYNEIFNSK